MAVSSLFLPVAFGLFFACTFDPASGGPGVWGAVVAAQLVLTFTMRRDQGFPWLPLPS